MPFLIFYKGFCFLSKNNCFLMNIWIFFFNYHLSRPFFFFTVLSIHMDDQIDGKTLIGSYVCMEQPGEFKWQPGSLTQVWFFLYILCCFSFTCLPDCYALIYIYIYNFFPPLGQAILNGYWVVFEDIDKAPSDMQSVLLPLLEGARSFATGYGEVLPWILLEHEY